MSDDEGPVDDKDFNDPEAWGYCDYCIFMVAVVDGRLVEHRRFRNNANDSACSGSGRDPVADVPYVAVARIVVDLYKGFGRRKNREHWQRLRFRNRAKAREGLKATLVDFVEPEVDLLGHPVIEEAEDDC